MNTTKVIGFATQFYTLWEVTEEKNYTQHQGKHIHTSTTYRFTYLKIISKSLDKVKSLFPDTPIDESLRGVCRSFHRTEKIDRPIDINHEIFPYGKFANTLIVECDDVFQLSRLLETNNHDHTPRRRVLARRKLIQLGELIRFDHMTSENDPAKWMSKRAYERHILVTSSEYLHADGEKIQIDLKVISRTGYDSAFGFVSIVTFSNPDGLQYVYKGSNPPYFEDCDKFYTVKCTVKHNEYQGIKQTLIQRIKIL